MKILLPRKIIPVFPTISAPLFFLAGPISGGADWQKDCTLHLLSKSPDCVVVCPCHWGESHELSAYLNAPVIDAENNQIQWERHYMELAGCNNGHPGCVLFWLPEESKLNPRKGSKPYAMDTRRELGKWCAYLKLLEVSIVIGGDSNFPGLFSIRDEFNNAFGGVFPFYESLDSLTAAAVEIASSSNS